MLSLSINNIKTLECFSYCSKLRELYLRRNGIESLEELGWLAKLDELRVLWLSHNPVASLPNYRATVLRLLPNLVKLDDKDVTPEEVEAAATEGAEIAALEPKVDDEGGGDGGGGGGGGGSDGGEDNDEDGGAVGVEDAGAYALSAIKTLLPLLNADQLAELASEIAQ